MLYYRFDKADVDSGYVSNEASLNSLKSLFGRCIAVDSICIQVSSSPEGSARRNAQLANERAQAMKDILLAVGSLRASLVEDQIKVKVVAENWEGLLEMVREHYWRHDRNKVISILLAENISDDTREWRLKRLDDGYTWDYLRRKYMPSLRQAVIVRFDYRTLIAPQVQMNMPVALLPVAPVEKLRVPEISPVKEIVPAATPESEHCTRNRYPVAVKTNLLYDLALIPNIGIEVGLGKNWTVGADWSYAWWDNDPKHLYWRIYGGELNFRRYFGSMSKKHDFAGHHLGAYGQMYTYDFELGGNGQMSKLTYGAGVEYGFALPLAQRLNLDFSVGFGMLTGEYMTYEPDEGCYVWKETRQRYYMGPTKAEISLVWKIGGRKGGDR